MRVLYARSRNIERWRLAEIRSRMSAKSEEERSDELVYGDEGIYLLCEFASISYKPG